MNLKYLSDQNLLLNTKALAKEERERLTVILHHIKEVERRRLFSTLKYESIHQYAMQELKYSQDQAGRRVAAARLLKELPEIEEKINSGALNLTTLGLAQTLFQREKKSSQKPWSRDAKANVLAKIENQTTRDADRIVWSFSSTPRPAVKEIEKSISNETVEYNFAAADSTQQKIRRLKGLLAHTHPGISLGELIDKLCDLGLEKWDPGRKVAAPRLKHLAKSLPSTQPTEPVTKSLSPTQPTEPMTKPPAIRVSLPAARNTWREAKSKCQNCGSFYALQIDHKFPKARGGSSETENLRLLCRSCNQRAAIEEFGAPKMEKFLN